MQRSTYPEDGQRIGTVMSMKVSENLVLHNIDDPRFRSHKLLDGTRLTNTLKKLSKNTI